MSEYKQLTLEQEEALLVDTQFPEEEFPLPDQTPKDQGVGNTEEVPS